MKSKKYFPVLPSVGGMVKQKASYNRIDSKTRSIEPEIFDEDFQDNLYETWLKWL